MGLRVSMVERVLNHVDVEEGVVEVDGVWVKIWEI